MKISLPEWRNPKYAGAAVFGLLGFLLIVLATSGTLTLGAWHHSFDISTGGKWLALIAGVIIFLAVLVILLRDYADAPTDDVTVGQPRIAHFLFASNRSAPLWLGIRIYLGLEWLNAGYHKLDTPAWRNGDSLKGYWTGAVAIPETGSPKINYALWRDTVQYMLDHKWYEWFNWIIMIGEVLVGLGLIFGALTAVSAFFGAVMNTSFMLSGSASSNPVLFALSIGIILAWRTAGLIGLDRFLLPMLGTPWEQKVAVGVSPASQGPRVAPTGS